MTRPRTGSAYAKDGGFAIAISLRPGSKPSRFVKPCPPRADGVPVDLIHARAVAADLQRRYDAGDWDPMAPAPTPEPAEAAPFTKLTPVVEYARAWIKTQRYESAPKDAKVLERYLAKAPLGAMPVGEVRAKHMLAFIHWLEAQPSERGNTLAPRTVRNAYDVVRRALDAAVIEELLTVNPCHAVHGKLPSIEDKVPGARQGWIYARDDIERLLSDHRIPLPRRVAYGLQFLTGCRFGELAVLRWSDYDTTMQPLGRLTIARAKKSVSKKEASTKTGAVKLVPVHPTLARLLDVWWRLGWNALIGRAPKAGDLLIPNQFERVRDGSRHNRDLGRDCAKLGIRHRHQHCARHSFISHVQDDGGDGQVIRWITHAPPRTAFDGYTRQQWTKLCAELGKLRIDLREDPLPPPMRGFATGFATAESEEPRKPLCFQGSSSVGARGFERTWPRRVVSRSDLFSGRFARSRRTDGGTSRQFRYRFCYPGSTGGGARGAPSPPPSSATQLLPAAPRACVAPGAAAMVSRRA
ncbi:MAG: tyrosine-type recombinase/integrase [Deltaproteobacteria bacterium]|nr:tyrosine-type recombinase/integrase [Deltaproteobacteria bacterium]